MHLGLLLLGLAATTTSGHAEEVPAGTPIVAISVVRDDVFDTSEPATSSWPYRVANALHFLTHESFVRSHLLFRVGDEVDPELLAESERLLRETGFLNPVTVRARPAPGGCEVVVRTHDQWTTEVSASYGRFGRRSHAGFALAEHNLLGWGKTLVLNLESQEERRTVTLRYHDPFFLGRRLRLEVERSHASDGSVDGFGLESPFFSLATPRAGGVDWRRESRTAWLYAGGKKAVSGNLDEHHMNLWGALRLPGTSTRRALLGVFFDQVHFGRWARTDGRPFTRPADRDLAGLRVGFEQQPPQWSVVHGFRGWQRQEDVPVGPSASASLGVSLPAFGDDRRRVLLRGGTSTSTLWRGWYAWANLRVDGRIETPGWVNGLTHFEVGAAQPGERGWRGRIACDLGHDLDRETQITLGVDTGLRGWDPDHFDGTSRAVANLEWRRRLTGEVLHLGVIGLSLFADGGRTWNARIGEPTRRFHADIGAGLLVELTRSSTVRIVRVEVAIPDDGRGAVFLATSSSLF